MLIAASQVSPETAHSNISGWLRLAQLDGLAAQLSSVQVDAVVAYIGVAAVVSALYGLLIQRLYTTGYRSGRRKARKEVHGEPSKPRQFLDPQVTPQALLKLYDGRTDLEGERLVEPYKGKWIKLRGLFENVTRPMPSQEECYLHFKGQWRTSLHLHFSGAEWRQRLETLQIGQEVALAGWVGKPTRYSVWVHDCELIPLSEAEDAVWVGDKPKTRRSPSRKPKAGAA